MKKTSGRAGILRRVWLLLAGSLALGAAMPASADVDVEIVDGLVSVEAENVPLQAVLEALARCRGLDLVQQAALERRVSIRAAGRPLAELLDDLLDTSDSYLLFLPAEGAPGGEAAAVPGTLWIFGEGPGYGVDLLETVLIRGAVGDRKTAVGMLRDAGTPEAVRALAIALADDDRRIRRAAIEALAATGTDEALAALASAAVGGDPATRAAAAEAIGRAGGDSARAYLGRVLEDGDPRLRLAAAEALADLGGDLSRAGVRRALSDPDPYVRQRAADIIQELDDEALFHALYPPRPE